MKNIRNILVVIAAMLVVVSCEPIENRNELKGKVTDDDIAKYIKIEQEIRNGKKSNFFTFASDGLKANVQFKHGLGTVTVSSMGKKVQCFVVAGNQEIIVRVLNPDASEIVEKIYPYTVEEAFDVAPQWAMLCGTGSKTWTWDESADPDCYGMGDVFANTPGWWVPAWGADTLDELEWKGATMTFSAIGAALTKTRTNGSKAVGQFGFNMYVEPKPTFKRSKGQFTTVGTTILNAKNYMDSHDIENKFEIIDLSNNKLHLITIDMAGRDTYNAEAAGWGQATHWIFVPVK